MFKKISLVFLFFPLVAKSAVFLEYRTSSDAFKTLHSQRIIDGQGQKNVNFYGSNIFKSCYASADVNPIVGQLTCTTHDGLNIQYACYGDEVKEVHFTKTKSEIKDNDSISLSLHCKR